MKVTLLNHTYLPATGGIENYLRFLSRELKRRGHEPTIMCKKHRPDLPDRERIDGVEVMRHAAWQVAKRDLGRKPRILAERLGEWLAPHVRGADLVIARFPHYGCAAARLGLTVPLVYMPAALSVNLSRRVEEGLKGRFFSSLWEGQLRAIESEAVLGAARVVVFSRNMSEQVSQAYGLGPDEIMVLPPGVDADLFAPRGKDEALLEELGIPPRSSVVLYVGRLSPEKNLPLLFHALRALDNESLRCVLVGCGPERERLEELAGELGIREKVRFAGERADVSRFYSSADLFVLPSLYEGFGQVLLEAMASGLPVIAMKHAPPKVMVGAPEIIEEGRSGYCLSAGVSEWRQKIGLLLSSPSLRSEMGERARALCEERFSWEGHVRALVGLAGGDFDGG